VSNTFKILGSYYIVTRFMKWMNDNKLNADNSIHACKKQLIVSVPDH